MGSVGLCSMPLRTTSSTVRTRPVVSGARARIRLPGSVSFVQGASAVDAGATSYGGAVHSADLKAGDRIGIVGLGGLGLTGARLAVLLGAEVHAAEPRRETWPIAKERGVISIVEDVLELAPLQLDTIVDFAGFGTTTAGAISAGHRPEPSHRPAGCRGTRADIISADHPKSRVRHALSPAEDLNSEQGLVARLSALPGFDAGRAASSRSPRLRPRAGRPAGTARRPGPANSSADARCPRTHRAPPARPAGARYRRRTG